MTLSAIFRAIPGSAGARTVLAFEGRARMMASARTSPMPEFIRSSRLAVLRSI